MDMEGGEDTKLEGPVGLHVNTIPIIVFLIRKYKALQMCSRVMFAKRAAN
jgi:hypothetical protein